MKDKSKPLVYIPANADLNFENTALPPPKTRYNATDSNVLKNLDKGKNRKYDFTENSRHSGSLPI